MVPLCQKERERAGERESTFEHLQLSCKSHCRALLLRYDFIAAPTGVEIEVITSSLLPEHWAANSLIPAINCICVPCVRLCVCVCVCMFLRISVERTEGFCCSSPTGTVRKAQPTHGPLMLLFLNINYMCCPWVWVFACFQLGVSEAWVWGRSAFALVY